MTTPETSGSWQLGFTVVLGVAVVGFFVGVSTGPDLQAGANPLRVTADVPHAEAAAAMPSYGMIRTRGRGTDSSWADEAAKLRVGATDGPRFADKAEALADRASNRAYAGAPPTVPHPVRQRSAAECLACHEDGLRIRDRVASAMSHAEYASCTQCHVVSEAPMPGALLPPDGAAGPNAFVGLTEPTEGERAWAIAPPTTPHRTSMRENCMACHGPDGREPLRTPHPERQSCLQCHPPSAELDQAPGGVR